MQELRQLNLLLGKFLAGVSLIIDVLLLVVHELKDLLLLVQLDLVLEPLLLLVEGQLILVHARPKLA